MKLASLAIIALVAACSAPASPQARPASPAASIPAAASISPAAVNPPRPSWTLGLGPTAISTVDFSCRLPVFDDHGTGSAGGFINFPSGTVSPDPGAGTSSITPLGRELVGDSYLHYYDRAYSRWLTVSRKAVSPDGSHYAYADRAIGPQADPQARATLHVVAVNTGAELTFDDGGWSSPYVVLDYATEGIYLTTTYVGYGLWLMNPATGAITKVANPWDVQGGAGNKVFWVGAVNASDPHPIAGVAPDQLDRLNLVDGSRTAWFYRPGSSVHFVSQDVGGHPIIVAGGVSGPEEFLLLFGPGVSRSIWTSGDRIPGLSSPISDSHGVWFGSPDGIFLYSETNGVQKISNQPGYPANGCF